MSYSDECLEAHNVYLDRLTSNMKNAHSIDTRLDAFIMRLTKVLTTIYYFFT